MLDSSAAIQPNKQVKIEDKFIDVGNFLSYELIDKTIQIQTENSFVSILFYEKDIVRIVMNPNEVPSLKSSFGVIAHLNKEIYYHMEDRGNDLYIKSSQFLIIIRKYPLRITILDIKGRTIVRENSLGMAYTEENEVICFKEMDTRDNFYGFGEKTGYLNKRGEKMTMWNTDVYAPHNPETDALYQSIPYFMTMRNGSAHGIFFDNTFKTVFDMKSSEDEYSFSAEGGQLDYYVLAGPTIKDVVIQYTFLSGRMPLPPKWSLGYHQSRYSYPDEWEVREIAETFREKEIPLDCIYLDIHYMNEYRVFTFDKNNFPNPEGLVSDLKAMGIKIVPIVDPGVKADPEYSIYQEGVRGDKFCKYIEGDIFFGEVWPGKSAFPDFTSSEVQTWWGDKHHFYTSLGIEGIWNDMNEPSVFNESKTMDLSVVHHNDGVPKTHKELHNLYGLLMGAATYEGMKKQLKGKRPFLLTRAGFAGIQRYAAVWTGDNRSFWEHLKLSLPMCMNLGLSGVAFSGPDVGGFAHDTTGQLLVRWTQVGSFTPFFRNHSAIGTSRQEPWCYNEENETIIKRYIEERYRWLPYLYTLFYEASKTGLPVMRPVVMEYPKDDQTYNLSNQFMLGESVMIAPIMDPDTNYRSVYLPKGNWYCYWTDKKFEGETHHLIKAELDELPIFVKENSVIPLTEPKQSTKEKDRKIEFHFYLGEDDINCILYEDDGETFNYEDGESFILEVSAKKIKKDEWNICTTTIQKNFIPSWETVELILHGGSADTIVLLNGTPVKGQRVDEQLLRIEKSFDELVMS